MFNLVGNKEGFFSSIHKIFYFMKEGERFSNFKIEDYIMKVRVFSFGLFLLNYYR